MGGEGSGRKPDPVKKLTEQKTPIGFAGEPFILPNYSGIKEGAKKGSATSFLQSGDNVSELTNDVGYLTAAGAENWLAVSNSYQVLSDDNWLSVSNSYVAVGGNVSDFTNDAGYITSAGAENWLVVSNAYQTLADNNWLDVSNSYTIGDNWLEVSNSYQTLACNNWLSVSNAYDAGSNWLAVSSGYVSTETDPIYIATSDAYIAVSASGGYQTHIEDESDPHGENLTQTGITSSGTISGANIASTADIDASGAALMRNMILDNTSGGYTASDFTQGTILVVYS